MSKASSRVIRGLLNLHCSHTPKPSSISGSLSRTHHSASSPSTGFRSLPTSSNGVSHRFPSSPSCNPHAFSFDGLGSCKLGGGSHGYGPGLRFFSLGSSGFGKGNGNFAKKIFDKPVSALSSTFSRYREAIGLQIEAFCRRNYLFLLGAGGVLVCALLWKTMFAIAESVVGISEGLAKYGFLALSSAIVAFAVSSDINCNDNLCDFSTWLIPGLGKFRLMFLCVCSCRPLVVVEPENLSCSDYFLHCNLGPFTGYVHIS